MIHAYRVTLTVTEPPDQPTLEANRAAVRTQIRAFGGDPLPREQVLLTTTDEGEVLLVWRTKTPPRRDLMRAIQGYAAGLTKVTHWRLEHHRCGNGLRRGCGPWTTLLESD